MPPQRVYLLRHARADNAVTDPARRPLTAQGLAQAKRLAAALGGAGVARVLSSPRRRCRDTVAPLAAGLGLDVEEDDALLEGTLAADTLRFLEALRADGAVVACTHGDIIPGVLELLRQDGVELPPWPGWPAASVWVLEGDGDRFVRAAYLPPA